MLVFNKPYLLADQLEWLIAHNTPTEISRGDIGLEASIQEGLDPDLAVNPEDANAMEQRQSGREKREAQVNDCFDHLEYRARAFGNGYLFSIKGDVIRLKRRKISSDQALIYKFLLACSRPELSKQLSSAFSELCKLAMSRFFGRNAVVFNIDAGAADRQIVGTDTRDAARYLAPHLGAQVSEPMLADISGAGDGGADIAAALGFGDAAPGHFAVLGQCAASSSEDYWRDKLQQPLRFQQLFHWTVDPVIAGFIPVLYRTSSGDWVSKPNVTRSVVFDRLRILNALNLSRNALPKSLRDSIRSSISAATANARTKTKLRKSKTKRAASLERRNSSTPVKARKAGVKHKKALSSRPFET